AVEGHVIRLFNPVEHARDGTEAMQIGRNVAAELELEIAMTVSGNRFFKAFREAVVEAVTQRLVARQRVKQPYRVAHENRLRRLQAAQERSKVEICEIERRLNGQAQAVLTHEVECRPPFESCQRVDHRAFEKR